MSKLGAMRGMPPAPIDTFRDGVSPVVRLYNWNLLAPVFKSRDCFNVLTLMVSMVRWANTMQMQAAMRYL